MRIRFLKQYGPYSEGEEVELDDAAAEQVLLYRIGERADIRHAVPPAKDIRKATTET